LALGRPTKSQESRVQQRVNGGGTHEDIYPPLAIVDVLLDPNRDRRLQPNYWIQIVLYL
jgi:hypothetical protein